MNRTPATETEEKLVSLQQQVTETNMKCVEVLVIINMARTELDECGDPIRGTELRAIILEHGKILSGLQSLHMSLHQSIHQTQIWLGDQYYQMAHDNFTTLERD